MLELSVLAFFAAGLLVGIFLGIPTIYPLLFGYLLFLGYGLKKGCRPLALLRMSLKGIRTVRNVLLIFLLIGVITGVWRACGTIAVIVDWSSRLILPSVFVLVSFLLCAFVSMLSGTSFGTAATIGVVCMTISRSMGLNPVVMGGAILSGVYFGDRCSPMSTSALLVGELTGTDLFCNIRRLLREQTLPLALTCLVYLLLGFSRQTASPVLDIHSLLAGHFSLHWAAFLPAVLIVALSLLRINIKCIMLASIALGGVLCLTLQHMDAASFLSAAVLGYHSSDPVLGPMFNGGGMISMLNVTLIVLVSSTYVGIFDQTGLLDGLKHGIARASRRITPFGCALLTSVAAGMVACNQTLTIILTYQLCRDAIPDRSELADTLSHSAMVVAPMIPWSIAAVVPISSIDAPYACIAAACYLYLLPLWKLLAAAHAGRRPSLLRHRTAKAAS